MPQSKHQQKNIIWFKQTTSVQSNLEKGYTTVLSPLLGANGFIRSLSQSNTRFLGPTWVSPTKQHLNRFCHICTAHPCDHHTDRETDTQTTLRATSVAIGRIYALHACKAAWALFHYY